jgi:EPS-associated MarR family transcriptional regulator
VRNPEVSVWAGLLVCAYPVIEVIYSVVRRAMLHQSPGAPDSGHLHSLIKVKLFRPKLAAHGVDKSIRNAAVSPIVWAFSAMPAIAATAMFDRPVFLALGLLACVLLYHFAYRFLMTKHAPEHLVHAPVIAESPRFQRSAVHHKRRRAREHRAVAGRAKQDWVDQMSVASEQTNCSSVSNLVVVEEHPTKEVETAHPARTSRHSEKTEDLHFRILKLLSEKPDLSQRELAEKLGVSNGKLHYCMRALIDRGLVKLSNFAHSKHHLGYAYLLTPAGIAHKANITGRFIRRKMAEYEALQREIALLQAELAADRTSQKVGE